MRLTVGPIKLWIAWVPKKEADTRLADMILKLVEEPDFHTMSNEELAALGDEWWGKFNFDDPKGALLGELVDRVRTQSPPSSPPQSLPPP